MQEQENQVHSVEWAESVVWAQAGIYQHVWHYSGRASVWHQFCSKESQKGESQLLQQRDRSQREEPLLITRPVHLSHYRAPTEEDLNNYSCFYPVSQRGEAEADPCLNGSITTSQQRSRIKENQTIDPHSSSIWIKKDTTACQLNINGFPVTSYKRSFVKCHSPKKIDIDFKFGFRQEVLITHSCFYSRLWAPLKAPQHRLNCKALFQITSFITFLWV